MKVWTVRKICDDMIVAVREGKKMTWFLQKIEVRDGHNS